MSRMPTRAAPRVRKSRAAASRIRPAGAASAANATVRCTSRAATPARASGHGRRLGSGLLRLPQRVRGADRALDLRRALGDLGELGDAPQLLDAELADIPVPAVDLHRLQGGAHGRLAGEQLGHGDFFGEAAAGPLAFLV